MFTAASTTALTHNSSGSNSNSGSGSGNSVKMTFGFFDNFNSEVSEETTAVSVTEKENEGEKDHSDTHTSAPHSNLLVDNKKLDIIPSKNNSKVTLLPRSEGLLSVNIEVEKEVEVADETIAVVTMTLKDIINNARKFSRIK